MYGTLEVGELVADAGGMRGLGRTDHIGMVMRMMFGEGQEPLQIEGFGPSGL